MLNPISSATFAQPAGQAVAPKPQLASAHKAQIAVDDTVELSNAANGQNAIQALQELIQVQAQATRQASAGAQAGNSSTKEAGPKKL